MTHMRRISPDRWAESDAERLRQLAEGQNGVVSRQQLNEAGLCGGAITRWLESGRIHRVHPHVYALGHTALSLRGRLHAALLYAGPGTVLSHTTAAWAWSLIDAEPRRIHLTIPGRRPSLPEVRVHHSRQVDATEHRTLPVTTVPRTLLDLAAVLPARPLRRALAEADFRGLLDPSEVENVLKRGRPGSRALRATLRSHMPQLARTLSVLEERFLEPCESAGIPLPEVNARVGRMKVDALWREQRVVVELDGAAAHGGWSAIKSDRQREMALRSLGYVVVRYTWDQVTGHRDDVITDLRGILDP